MATNVQVILSRDVPNLGRIGEIVNVKPVMRVTTYYPSDSQCPYLKETSLTQSTTGA